MRRVNDSLLGASVDRHYDRINSLCILDRIIRLVVGTISARSNFAALLASIFLSERDDKLLRCRLFTIFPQNVAIYPITRLI